MGYQVPGSCTPIFELVFLNRFQVGQYLAFFNFWSRHRVSKLDSCCLILEELLPHSGGYRSHPLGDNYGDPRTWQS
jgi:hypothetical protein